MITEAIILAGGLGTRLREIVHDVPKCMAPINGTPFLHYVIEHALQQGITKIILSVGYKKEIIYNYFSNKRLNFQLEYCEEDEPLGTGGAIAKALNQCITNNVLILNGDTLMQYNLAQLQNVKTDATIITKELESFDRYGTITTNADKKIISFNEKIFCKKGLINTGVYIINSVNFLGKYFPEKFSIEKDYFEKYITTDKIYAATQNGYFIDIGIPEDYKKAQTELPNL